MIIDCDVGFKNWVQVLTKNHVDTVGRYYCSQDDQNGAYKIISPREALQLRQARIQMIAVHEASAVDLSKGRDHANAALKCAHDVGQPSGTAIYFAIEKDGGFTATDMMQVGQYFADIKTMIAGKFAIGIYSNGAPCAALLASKSVDYTWLTAASYSHDGTLDFYVSGRWSLAQIGPLDIEVAHHPSWKIEPNVPNWKIDVDISNGPIGSFLPNPPPTADLTV